MKIHPEHTPAQKKTLSPSRSSRAQWIAFCTLVIGLKKHAESFRKQVQKMRVQ